MKYIASLLLLVSAIHLNGALRIPGEWLTLKKGERADDVCQGKIFSCADCHTSRVCRPSENGDIINYKDSSCPAERPWCEPHSGTCVANEPPTCGTQDDFVCLKKNHYFPDNDCHRFHYCDSDYVARLFECNPRTKVFNPQTQTCEDPATTSVKCGTFSCKNQPVKKMKHDVYVNYFAMCKEDANDDKPLVVNVCPDLYVLNTTSQVCEPDCKSYYGLNIPDVENCHYYYHCNTIYITSGETFLVRKKLKCPEGQAYDQAQYACVDEGTVAACTKA